MAISPQTGIPAYLGTNGANGTTAVGKRNKVANTLGTSATTGQPNYPASTVSAATGTPAYLGPNSSNGTTVTARPAAGSLNVNTTVTGKPVYGGVYS